MCERCSRRRTFSICFCKCRCVLSVSRPVVPSTHSSRIGKLSLLWLCEVVDNWKLLTQESRTWSTPAVYAVRAAMFRSSLKGCCNPMNGMGEVFSNPSTIILYNRPSGAFCCVAFSVCDSPAGSRPLARGGSIFSQYAFCCSSRCDMTLSTTKFTLKNCTIDLLKKKSLLKKCFK